MNGDQALANYSPNFPPIVYIPLLPIKQSDVYFQFSHNRYALDSSEMWCDGQKSLSLTARYHFIVKHVFDFIFHRGVSSKNSVYVANLLTCQLSLGFRFFWLGFWPFIAVGHEFPFAFVLVLR